VEPVRRRHEGSQALSSPRLKLPIVVFVLLVLQTGVLQRMQLHRIHPDVLLLAAVAAGIAGGSERGAIAGFFIGLVADLFVQTPLGLCALTFCLVGFAVGAVQSSMIRSTWWITPITGFFGTAGGVVLFGLIGTVIGQTQLVRPRLGIVALVVGLSSAVMALPVATLVGWAMSDGTSESAYAR
jgi:rod shape-determining protein MreD